MNRFVVAGKEASFGYYIEGSDEKVKASLYISKEQVRVREFSNKHFALSWIKAEVLQLMGAEYYGR